MIIQFILSFGLIVLLIYALIARKSTRLVSAMLGLVAVVALVFVWFPELTNTIANAVGIGRGADLILYFWLLASMLVAFNLHLKCRQLSHDLTLMARRMALDRPIVPGTTPPPSKR